MKCEIHKTYVNKIMRHLLNDHIWIPTFQRDFIWNIDNARDLVDSILKNYPIGSMVFLQVFNPTLAKLERKITDMSKKDEVRYPIYLLDGQQRLMTLIKLLVTCEWLVWLPINGADVFVSHADDLVNGDENICVSWVANASLAVTNDKRQLMQRVADNGNVYAKRILEADLRLYIISMMQSKESKKVNRAFAIAETLSYFAFPVNEIILEGNETYKDAVKVFRRINMAGVPVDIDFLESLDV